MRASERKLYERAVEVAVAIMRAGHWGAKDFANYRIASDGTFHRFNVDESGVESDEEEVSFDEFSSLLALRDITSELRLSLADTSPWLSVEFTEELLRKLDNLDADARNATRRT